MPVNKVEYISKAEFYTKFKVKEVDLVELGIFDQDDFKKLEEIFGYLKGGKRLRHLITGIPYLLTHFFDLLRNFDQIILNQIKDIRKFSRDEEIPLKNRYPISDYIMKASIVSSFKPKKILEIGTYFGWGTASIKAASPTTDVYTMNPKENSDANNPINENNIGEVYRNKNLKINQIWADSTNYDYAKLPSIDVTYIDGNHEYSFVYSDLENTSKITEKAIVLDDYIPSKNSPRGGVRAWGDWNKSVVSAVDDFLKMNDKLFKYAYWIKETPICVLIK